MGKNLVTYLLDTTERDSMVYPSLDTTFPTVRGSIFTYSAFTVFTQGMGEDNKNECHWGRGWMIMTNTTTIWWPNWCQHYPDLDSVTLESTITNAGHGPWHHTQVSLPPLSATCRYWQHKSLPFPPRVSTTHCQLTTFHIDTVLQICCTCQHRYSTENHHSHPLSTTRGKQRAQVPS